MIQSTGSIPRRRRDNTSCEESYHHRRSVPKPRTVSTECHALKCATKPNVRYVLSIAGHDEIARCERRFSVEPRVSKSINSNQIRMPAVLSTLLVARVLEVMTIANNTNQKYEVKPESMINFILIFARGDIKSDKKLGPQKETI